MSESDVLISVDEVNEIKVPKWFSCFQPPPTFPLVRKKPPHFVETLAKGVPAIASETNPVSTSQKIPPPTCPISTNCNN